MNQKLLLRTAMATIATFAAYTEAHAQVYYYPPNTNRLAPRSRVIVGSSARVYSNNGVRYQSLRPSYGQPQVHSNGRYYVQPGQTYVLKPPTYYNTQPVPSYYGNSNPSRVYYGNSQYWSQPSTTYQSNYGTGYYVNPR